MNYSSFQLRRKLAEFEIIIQLKKLPCKHFFHVECILPRPVRVLCADWSCPQMTLNTKITTKKIYSNFSCGKEEDIKSLHNSMFT
uniref:Uncharacterized protein n=1 Tax=Strigamia maritima TaxID=126957 RepID=T1IYV0_STRMM